MQQNIQRGVVLAILTALAYSFMGALVKFISSDVPTAIIVFIRFVVGFLFLSPTLLYHLLKDKDFTFKTKKPGTHLIRGLAGVATLGFFYYSLKYVPLVSAVLLNNTFPLFMPFIVRLNMGIKTSKSLLMAIAIGFIGAIFVLHPGHGFFHWPSFFALLSGLAAAIAMFYTRQLSKTERPLTIMFYYFIISILVSGIFTVNEWHEFNAQAWPILILISLIATIYQICLTQALGYAPARIISPLLYLSLIFSGLLGWIFWGHFPTIYSLIGILFVTVSAILTVLLGRKQF